MKGIEFDKDNYRPKGVAPKNSWAVEFVTKATGYRVTDPSQINLILGIIFVLLMSIALYNFHLNTKKDLPTKTEAAVQQQLFLDQTRGTEIVH